MEIYESIARRTGGDVYIGVVGPVRTGKSTLIKAFMETLVIPQIQNDSARERAVDELPQSAAGRTIMTTEPKFIPEDAVKIPLGDSMAMNVRMIDCVGYIVPSSIGYFEDSQPRMVKTPWLEQEIPFNMAAQIGTQKVITEHSTMGLVVTADGSFTDIPRTEYEEAEAQVIGELQEIHKPFVVLLNCQNPAAAAAQRLREELAEKYGVTVVAVNCQQLSESDIRDILQGVLLQFPVQEIELKAPGWLCGLERGHWLRQAVMGSIVKAAQSIQCVGEVPKGMGLLEQCEYVDEVRVQESDPGTGCAKAKLTVQCDLFYRVLGEQTGLAIPDESALMSLMVELSAARKAYDKVRGALEQVAATGYGIVMPSLDELSLQEPEMMKQAGRYGVRLRASAPSIHMMAANITTEVNPIVGSEKQSRELVEYMLEEFEQDPRKIWESNIFGKSLHELVNEGLHNKLYRMPPDARTKLQETVERIINDGCSGLICIIL